MITTVLNNRYQILEILGRGGFGETYLAIDTHMPSARKCVIKQLKPAVQSPQIPNWLKERFQREAAILEELGENNPQIPRLYAYFTQDGHFFLVQEWVEGLTLSQIHQQQGNLSEEEVREILIKLLPVLDYIHSRRIIHRDVKPDNIILRDSNSLPVLIDFGVMKEAMATVVNPDGRSAYSVALGTPGYMASEQAAGRPVYSSDLYSLGLTAVFLLTGKTPQYLETDSHTGEIIWRKEVPGLHSNLASVIDRAIRFHPRDRFATAQEMLNALQPSITNLTEATIAIAPGNLSTEASLKGQPRNIEQKTPVVLSDMEADENESSSLLSWLLMGGIIMGAFALGFLGFMTFLSKQNSTPTISPSTVFESPEPETFPTVEQPKTESQPTFSPRPRPETSTTPEPETSVESTPEASTTPEPETSVESTPEASTTPEPAASSNPTPVNSPSPTSKTTPTPIPEPSATIIPVTPPPSSKPDSANSSEEKKPPQEKSNSLKIPIIKTGSKDSQARQQLGSPTSVNSGIWGNSQAVLYRNVVPGKVDIGYLYDINTGKIRQTEVSFNQSAGLPTLKRTVNNLLGGKTPATVQQSLERIYQRQSNQYNFVVGNLEGIIQRQSSDRIYVGIWEADFH
jgi:serine/threonine-protein kinase